MSGEKTASIPSPVVQRLTKYLVHVRHRRRNGEEWVASHQIAEALALTSSTVRQDLSHLAFSGTSKRGYETEVLEQVLIKELGADRVTNAAIVGAGNLGRALAQHGGFEKEGFHICAVFDSDPKVIGRKIGKMTVMAMGELSRAIRSEKIAVVMVAVPESSAQEVADTLVASGVTGVLNLTSAHIRVPDKVSVVDARIISSLQELLHMMKATRGKKGH
jgi:redox-sensing transcriptional repressor